jgi:predicted TIM-barrel fold metal-dependent hydrolase
VLGAPRLTTRWCREKIAGMTTQPSNSFRRRSAHVVIDADGHVCEPVDLWERNLPASMRARGLRVRFNEQIGTQQLLVEDTVGIPLGLAGLGNAGMRKNRDYGNALRYPEDLHLGGLDARERLEVMDAEGIDIAVLYCGLGQALGGIQDRELAVACHQVWNDWIADWVKPDPARLIGTAVLPAHDPIAAAKEVERIAALGLRAGVIRPNKVYEHPLWSPVFDPMYEALAAHRIPLGLHGAGLYDMEGTSKRMMDLMALGTHHALILFFDQYMTLANLACGGVLERHPDLRVLVLESGGGWIGHWMDRFDEFLSAYDWAVADKIRMKPSEYFRRQCVISFDPGERSMAAMAELAGEDNLIWASDFPHSDAKYPGVVDELLENLEKLPPARAAKVSGANAARVYGIERAYSERAALAR